MQQQPQETPGYVVCWSTCEHQENFLLCPNIACSSQAVSAIAPEVSWQHYIHLQMAEVFKAKSCAGDEHTRNGKTPNRRKMNGNDPVPVPLPSIQFTEIHKTGFTARILYSLPPWRSHVAPVCFFLFFSSRALQFHQSKSTNASTGEKRETSLLLMKFSLFFLARNKNNKASTSEITASKQAKQLLQLVFFFFGGGV